MHCLRGSTNSKKVCLDFIQSFWCDFDMKLWNKLSWYLSVPSNAAGILPSFLMARGAMPARTRSLETGVVQAASVMIQRAKMIAESNLSECQIEPHVATLYLANTIIKPLVDVHKVAALVPHKLLSTSCLSRSTILDWILASFLDVLSKGQRVVKLYSK